MQRRSFLLSTVWPLLAGRASAAQFGGLSDSKIIAGLKEALELRAGNQRLGSCERIVLRT